jgi:hypothetical protein
MGWVVGQWFQQVVGDAWRLHRHREGMGYLRHDRPGCRDRANTKTSSYAHTYPGTFSNPNRDPFRCCGDRTHAGRFFYAYPSDCDACRKPHADHTDPNSSYLRASVQTGSRQRVACGIHRQPVGTVPIPFFARPATGGLASPGAYQIQPLSKILTPEVFPWKLQLLS